MIQDLNSGKALGPNPPLIQWVLEPSSFGVNWIRHDPDFSPPYTAEVIMGGTKPPLLVCVFMACKQTALITI
jgi:hypothetical protein